jgi:hypothetical protein
MGKLPRLPPALRANLLASTRMIWSRRFTLILSGAAMRV